MRKADIKRCGVYTDGKGNTRQVLDMGPQYTLYPSQQETDNLQYRILTKKKGPYTVGDIRNSTTAAFASWAKSMVNV